LFLHLARINRTYLSKLEKGASHPGLEIIAKLATVLAVEPGELLRSRPSMTRRN
jgi:transcriptional regulator with XRE-family HTH domain